MPREEDRLYDDLCRSLADWQPTGEAATGREHLLRLLRTAGPAALRRTHDAGHVTAGAVILSADRQRVLLCLHGKFHKWLQLGGHCEPTDDTIAGVALREAVEESGIEGLRLLDTRPIDVHVHAVVCGDRASYHHDVRFALVAPPDAVERVSDESDALGWFTPDRLPTPLGDSVPDLLHTALAAHA